MCSLNILKGIFVLTYGLRPKNLNTVKKCIRLFACLSMLLLSCSGFAQDKKDNHSLLWEITGPGVIKPSYLYGTMHVSNKMAFNFQDTFYVALKSVEVVALEINLDSFLVNMIRSSSFDDMEKLREMMSGQKDFYEKMTELKSINIDLYKEELASNDNLLNQLLYRTDGREQEYEEQTYLDLFIFQAAKKLRKQVTNLEDFNTMEKYSYLAMFPDKDKKKEGFNDDYFSRSRLSDQMETAYRNADLDLIDSITRTESISKNFMHYFIVKRNQMMSETIDSVIKSGQSIFAACGVAHLPGDSGIIEMLRSYGYTLRPVKAAITSKSHKSREQLEQMIAPQKMSDFSPADSSFSLSVPGEMQHIPKFSEIDHYIYPDMANGSFYQVSHINTYGSLNQLGKDYYCKQIDSILYEYTPGDILKKDFIPTVGAYSMYDVTSRVSLDNYIRYRIYVGDMDVYIFKLVGIKDYVLSKYGNTFFNSISLKEHRGNAFKQLDFPKAGFSVSMPENHLTEDLITTEYAYKHTGNVNMKMQATDPVTGRYYLLIAGSMFDFDFIEEDEFELSYLAESLVKDRHYKELTSQNCTQNGIPAREFSYKDSTGNYLFIKTITVGPQYYLLLTAQTDSTFPHEYFNSFRTMDHQYTETFQPYNDEEMYFTVNTTSYIGKRNSTIQAKYGRLLQKAMRSEYMDDDEYFPYDNDKWEDLCSGQSAECVDVKLSIENPYVSYTGIKEYWGQLKTSLMEDEGLVLLSEKYNTLADSVYVADFMLGDTNSVKTIRVKAFLKGGALYLLRAVGQDKELSGAWTKQVFETFAPADTLIRSLPFGDKSDLFIEHLMSSDTVLNAQAIAMASMLPPDSVLTSKMIKYINSDAFKKNKVEKRCDLLALLADTANMEPLKMLEKIYMDAGDTSEIKFVVLEILAAKKTEASLKLLCSLILEDTPLDISSYSMDGLFIALDSVRYPKILFPELLSLSRYQEYREPIYTLLADLLDDKMISPALYKDRVKEIVTDAREKYKRTYAEASDYLEEDEDRYSYYNFMDSETYGKDPYITLLMPYDTMASVKKYFDKVMSSKVERFMFPLLLAQIENGRPYIDSLPSFFSKSDKWRTQFYDALVESGHKKVFDSTYLTQENFARATAFPEENPPDEIVFIGRRKCSESDSSGYVYFFKCKKTDDQLWRLRYSGYQPIDSTSVCSSPKYSNGKGEKIENSEEIEKMITDILDKLRFLRRKRVSGNQDYEFSLDDLGMY